MITFVQIAVIGFMYGADCAPTRSDGAGSTAELAPSGARNYSIFLH